jgi:hypothetical protein
MGRQLVELDDGEKRPGMLVMDKSGETSPSDTAAMLRAEKMVRRLDAEFGTGRKVPPLKLLDIYHDDVRGGEKKGVCVRLAADSEKGMDKALVALQRKFPNAFSEISRDKDAHEVTLGTYYDDTPGLARVVSLLHVGLQCTLSVAVKAAAEQNGKGFKPALEIVPQVSGKAHRGLLADAIAHYISSLVPSPHSVSGESGTRKLVLSEPCPDQADALRWAEGLRKRVDEKLQVSGPGGGRGSP